MEMDSRTHVEIKCNVCGEETGFWPMRVMFPPECECGNKDSGNCLRDWPNDNYGNFTLIKKELLVLALKRPWDKKTVPR